MSRVTKAEFTGALRQRLGGLSAEDVDRSLEYYCEMIDDRIEDGLDEEEAVAALGSIDDIVSERLSDTPLRELIKERVTPRRGLRIWEIVLLVIGSPLWLAILISIAAAILSVYVSIWAAVISLYTVVLSLGAGAVSGFAGIIFSAVRGNSIASVAFAGAGLLCAGLTIFAFIGCNQVAKGVVVLSRRLLLAVKRSVAGKDVGK